MNKEEYAKILYGVSKREESYYKSVVNDTQEVNPITLQKLRNEFKQEIEIVRREFKQEIDTLRNELRFNYD